MQLHLSVHVAVVWVVARAYGLDHDHKLLPSVYGVEVCSQCPPQCCSGEGLLVLEGDTATASCCLPFAPSLASSSVCFVVVVVVVVVVLSLIHI